LPLFDALIRLSVEETVWDAAGELDASLRRKGVAVPPMDIIIAQVCIHHRIFLYTLDDHFRLVPGLKLFRPDTQTQRTQ
jgi:predicted nucleic acid-binding protein